VSPGPGPVQAAVAQCRWSRHECTAERHRSRRRWARGDLAACGRIDRESRSSSRNGGRGAILERRRSSRRRLHSLVRKCSQPTADGVAAHPSRMSSRCFGSPHDGACPSGAFGSGTRCHVPAARLGDSTPEDEFEGVESPSPSSHILIEPGLKRRDQAGQNHHTDSSRAARNLTRLRNARPCSTRPLCSLPLDTVTMCEICC
jgi:hypothetical protein